MVESVQVEITVDPAERYFPTGVRVRAGETYRFRAQGRWADAGIPCDANGWIKPWAIAGLPFNRVRFKRFFVLCGNLGRDESTNFAIGGEGAYTVPGEISPGTELFLFANDLWWMYGNNRALQPAEGGPLRVSIART